MKSFATYLFEAVSRIAPTHSFTPPASIVVYYAYTAGEVFTFDNEYDAHLKSKIVENVAKDNPCYEEWKKNDEKIRTSAINAMKQDLEKEHSYMPTDVFNLVYEYSEENSEVGTTTFTSKFEEYADLVKPIVEFFIDRNYYE